MSLSSLRVEVDMSAKDLQALSRDQDKDKEKKIEAEFCQKNHRIALYNELCEAFSFGDLNFKKGAKAELTKLFKKIESRIDSSQAVDEKLISDFKLGFPKLVTDCLGSKESPCPILVRDGRLKALAYEIGTLYVMAYVRDMFESFELLALNAEGYQKDQEIKIQYMKEAFGLAEEQFDGLKTKVNNFAKIAESEAKSYGRKLVSEKRKFSLKCQNALADMRGKQESVKIDIQSFHDQIKNETNKQAIETKKRELIARLEEIKQTESPKIREAKTLVAQPKIENDHEYVKEAKRFFERDEIKKIEGFRDSYSKLQRFDFSNKHFLILNLLIYSQGGVKAFREMVEKALKPLIKKALDQTSFLISSMEVEAFWGARKEFFNKFVEDFLAKYQPNCFQIEVAEKIRRAENARNEAAKSSSPVLELINTFCLNLGVDKQAAEATKAAETKPSSAGFFSFFKRTDVSQKQQPKEQAIVAELKPIDGLQILSGKVADVMVKAEEADNDHKGKIKKFNDLFFKECSELLTQFNSARQIVIDELDAEITKLNEFNIDGFIESNALRQEALSFPMRPLRAPSKKQQEIKEEEVKEEIDAKAPLLSPMPKSQDSAAVAGPEEMPIPSEDNSFKLPRAGRYAFAGVFSGFAGVVATIAAVSFLMSNPAGWATGLLLLGAAALLIGCAVVLGKKANYFWKINKLIKRHQPYQQKILIEKDKELEKMGTPESLRKHMMKNKIIFDPQKRDRVDQDVETARMGHMPCTFLGSPDIPLYYSGKDNRFFLIYRQDRKDDLLEDVTEDNAYTIEEKYYHRQQI